MNLEMLCVGRPRDAAASALHDRYAERIRRLGVDYRTLHVAEVRADGKYSEDHVRKREAGLLLERLPAGRRVIALDRSGRTQDSESLARSLGKWVPPRATFIIGGPLGLHPSVRDRAEACWALSALTLPHELARVLLAEQLYRALTILRRIPYHK